MKDTTHLCFCIDLSVEKGFRCGQKKEHIRVFFQSALLLLLSQFTILRAARGSEPFQVTLLIYSHFRIILAPSLSFTLRYFFQLLLLLLSAIGKINNFKKWNTPSPRPVILHISPIEAAFHIIKLLHLLLLVMPAELLVSPCLCCWMRRTFQNSCDLPGIITLCLFPLCCLKAFKNHPKTYLLLLKHTSH